MAARIFAITASLVDSIMSLSAIFEIITEKEIRNDTIILSKNIFESSNGRRGAEQGMYLDTRRARYTMEPYCIVLGNTFDFTGTL